MSSSDYIAFMTLTDKLKKGLMTSPDLLSFCENYATYAAQSRSTGDQFLTSLCNAHVNLPDIPQLTQVKYAKYINPLMDIIIKDKLLLDRLQSLCKVEIEEEFREHEDMREKKLIVQNIGLLIDFHTRLCSVIATKQSKIDAKNIDETVNIWLFEQKLLVEESKQAGMVGQQNYLSRPSLKFATHILGILGTFKSGKDKLLFGSYASPDMMRKELLQFLVYFSKQGSYQLVLDEKEKEKLKLFAEALASPKNLTHKDIMNILVRNKSLVMLAGWDNKRHNTAHCVGLYAFIKGDFIILVCCNRGEGIEFVRDEKGNPNFSGNIILSIPNHEQSREAICKLFTRDSPFSSLKFENAEQFYKSLDRFVKHYHFMITEFQPLKLIKMNNCALANQKSLLRAILSKKSYKTLTHECRKKEIIVLLRHVKHFISEKPPSSLNNCMEFQILYNYLLKTESAFARNNIIRQQLLLLVYNALSDIRTSANPSFQKEIDIALTRFRNDRLVGLSRYQSHQEFKIRVEFNSQWNQLKDIFIKKEMVLPQLLDYAYTHFLILPNIETAKKFKIALLSVNKVNQDIRKDKEIASLLHSLLNLIDKKLITEMEVDIKANSSNDDEFKTKAGQKKMNI